MAARVCLMCKTSIKPTFACSACGSEDIYCSAACCSRGSLMLLCRCQIRMDIRRESSGCKALGFIPSSARLQRYATCVLGIGSTQQASASTTSVPNTGPPVVASPPASSAPPSPPAANRIAQLVVALNYMWDIENVYSIEITHDESDDVHESAQPAAARCMIALGGPATRCRACNDVPNSRDSPMTTCIHVIYRRVTSDTVKHMHIRSAMNAAAGLKHKMVPNGYIEYKSARALYPALSVMSAAYDVRITGDQISVARH